MEGRKGIRRCGVSGSTAESTKAGQAGHVGKGNGEEVFLIEVEDPSLVERETKKKPPRRLNETESGAGANTTPLESFQCTDTREPWGARPWPVELMYLTRMPSLGQITPSIKIALDCC